MIEYTYEVKNSSECNQLEKCAKVVTEHIDKTYIDVNRTCRITRQGDDVFLFFHPSVPTFCAVDEASFDGEYLILRLDGSSTQYFVKVGR